MKTQIKILLISGAVIIALAAVFHKPLLTRAGAFLIHQDPIEPADAVLVLGGGRAERITQGIELYKKKYGKMLVITGQWVSSPVLRRDNWALRAKQFAVTRLGFPENKIILILEPTSTYYDAVLSKAECRKRGYKSIVVTSEPYHTLRAYLIFRHVYRGSGIKVMIYPVQKSWYRADNWWKSPPGAESWYRADYWWTTRPGAWKTAEEYFKLAYYLLRGRIL
jgi:uncharacterized SAM-binding protein YcdF (DUF218 family)